MRTGHSDPSSRAVYGLVMVVAALIAVTNGQVAAAKARLTLLITNPATLKAIESNVGDFGLRLTGNPVKRRENAWLYDHAAGYRDVVRSLTFNLERIRKGDPALSVTMATAHRLFDVRWLRSSAAYFELVGIVNRMDRKPFHPETCGELRFIYRLKYATRWRGSAITSRLPFTVNLVTWLYDEGGGLNCAAIARRWALPDEPDAIAPCTMVDRTRGTARTTHAGPRTIEVRRSQYAERALAVDGATGPRRTRRVSPARLHTNIQARAIDPGHAGKHARHQAPEG